VDRVGPSSNRKTNRTCAQCHQSFVFIASPRSLSSDSRESSQDSDSGCRGGGGAGHVCDGRAVGTCVCPTLTRQDNKSVKCDKRAECARWCAISKEMAEGKRPTPESSYVGVRSNLHLLRVLNHHVLRCFH